MSSSSFATWIGRAAVGLAALLVVAVVVLMVYQRFSDGPTGPLSGGTFSSGERVEGPILDWSVLQGDFEFELVGEQSSRTAGGLFVDGNLYITCDLGFVWSRLPSGMGRNLLHVIWLLKNWHHKALADGRVRIRKDGRVYTVQIERVEDPEIIEALKTAIEAEARKFFAPNDLGPRPQESPNDIWFFRVSQ